MKNRGGPYCKSGIEGRSLEVGLGPANLTQKKKVDSPDNQTGTDFISNKPAQFVLPNWLGIEIGKSKKPFEVGEEVLWNEWGACIKELALILERRQCNI